MVDAYTGEGTGGGAAIFSSPYRAERGGEGEKSRLSRGVEREKGKVEMKLGFRFRRREGFIPPKSPGSRWMEING